MDRVQLARLVQIGFFAATVAMFLTVYFGWGGTAGMFVAVAATIPFSIAVIHGMKCPNCGVSYYFDANNRGWNVTGVNLLKPVKPRCAKCGAAR